MNWMQTVLAIGDLHLPFVNKSALQKVINISKDLKPDIIIQLGDLFDHFAHSKYPRSHNLMTPRREVEKAREMAEKMWFDLQKINPKASCYNLTGNHDSRPYKRILERYPEIERMVSFKELYTFNGVTTIHDPREPLEIEKVLYMHGHYTGLGKHANFYLQSVVCGHTHVGGVVFFQKKGKILFEMNAGMLADIDSIPLSYTPMKLNKTTLGIGLIDYLGPRFIPL